MHTHFAHPLVAESCTLPTHSYLHLRQLPGNRRAFQSYHSSLPPSSASISSMLGRDDFNSSGKFCVMVYSLTPMGLLMFRSAYSTTVSFLDLQIRMPMVGVSC